MKTVKKFWTLTWTDGWAIVGRPNVAGVMACSALLLPMAGMASASVQTGAATTISVTSSSWNTDLVYAAFSPYDTATSFDGSNAWIAQDAVPYNYPDFYDGLPSNSSDPSYPFIFTSNANNGLNSSSTSFEFQSFLGNNSNYFNSAGGTLTLTTPTAFENLAILAASCNSGLDFSTVTMTLNFVGGTTSSPITYDIYDWGDSPGPTNQWAFADPIERSHISSDNDIEEYSTVDTSSENDFEMYETDFDLSSTYANELISSISFSGANSGDVGIFALSGYANPTQPVLTDPPPNDPPASPVPTPATLPLTIMGGIALALVSIRRRGKNKIMDSSN